jgi:hypothetical protein
MAKMKMKVGVYEEFELQLRERKTIGQVALA